MPIDILPHLNKPAPQRAICQRLKNEMNNDIMVVATSAERPADVIVVVSGPTSTFESALTRNEAIALRDVLTAFLDPKEARLMALDALTAETQRLDTRQP